MDIFQVVLIIILIAIILSQFAQMKRTKEINDRLKKIVQDSNEQYQDVVQVNKNLRNIRHDINKQKAIIKAMEEGETIEELTGVEVIDRIIHFKGKEIADKNIGFSVDAARLSNMDIGNGALISIFTNIFDNAIEACEGLENPWIRCNIVEDSDSRLHMIVENSKSQEVVLDNNNIVTTKENKELHGYGLNIIKDLIHKNNGTVYVEDKGESFYLCVKM